jgi:hypothetical protein
VVGDSGSEEHRAASDDTDRVEQLLLAGAEVDPAACAGFDGPPQTLTLVLAGEHEDVSVWGPPGDAANDGQAVGDSPCELYHHNVRPQVARAMRRRDEVRHLASELEIVGTGDKRPEAGADDRIGVTQHDAQRPRPPGHFLIDRVESSHARAMVGPRGDPHIGRSATPFR